MQGNVFGMSDRKSHHVAVHHEKRSVALESQILLIFNENADCLGRIVGGTRIGRVNFTCRRKVPVNLVFALFKGNRNRLSGRFPQFFCGGKCFLNRLRRVFRTGWIRTKIGSVNDLRFIAVVGVKREDQAFT